MRQPRRIARRANLGRGLVAKQICRARRRRGFDLSRSASRVLAANRSKACWRSASDLATRRRNSAVSASSGTTTRASASALPRHGASAAKASLSFRVVVSISSRAARSRAAELSRRASMRRVLNEAIAAAWRSSRRCGAPATPGRARFAPPPPLRPPSQASTAPPSARRSDPRARPRPGPKAKVCADRPHPRDRGGARCPRSRRVWRRARLAERGCLLRRRNGCAAHATRRPDSAILSAAASRFVRSSWPSSVPIARSASSFCTASLIASASRR